MSHFVAQSGFFTDTVLGHLRPPGQIMQWNIASPNPSGFRHAESGAIRRTAQFGNRGGFTAQKESGIPINFGNIIVESGLAFQTNTTALTFNFGQVNSNPLSRFNNMFNNGSGTVGTDLVGFNFRIWIGNLTAFDIAAVSGETLFSTRPIFHFHESAEWRRNYQLSLEISGVPVSGVFIVPSSMPNSPNISSRGNDISISGSFVDREFTNFIYVRGFFPELPLGQNYRLGTYGGLGEETFRIKFSYDYTALDANIINPDDLIDYPI